MSDTSEKSSDTASILTAVPDSGGQKINSLIRLGVFDASVEKDVATPIADYPSGQGSKGTALWNNGILLYSNSATSIYSGKYTLVTAEKRSDVFGANVTFNYTNSGALKNIAWSDNGYGYGYNFGKADQFTVGATSSTVVGGTFSHSNTLSMASVGGISYSLKSQSALETAIKADFFRVGKLFAHCQSAQTIVKAESVSMQAGNEITMVVREPPPASILSTLKTADERSAFLLQSANQFLQLATIALAESITQSQKTKTVQPRLETIVALTQSRDAILLLSLILSIGLRYKTKAAAIKGIVGVDGVGLEMDADSVLIACGAARIQLSKDGKIAFTGTDITMNGTSFNFATDSGATIGMAQGGGAAVTVTGEAVEMLATEATVVATAAAASVVQSNVAQAAAQRELVRAEGAMDDATAAVPPSLSQAPDAAPAPVAAVESALSTEQAAESVAAAVVKEAIETALIAAQQAVTSAESTAAATRASVLAVGKQEGANVQLGADSATVHAPMQAELATSATSLKVTPMAVKAS